MEQTLSRIFVTVPLAVAVTILIRNYSSSKDDPQQSDSNQTNEMPQSIPPKNGPYPVPKTKPSYQLDSALRQLNTTVLKVEPCSNLPEAELQLFGKIDENKIYQIVITSASIFHPQGGGQPSDRGKMETELGQFEVIMVRRNEKGELLHLGKFSDLGKPIFRKDDMVTQSVDSKARNLHSRYHTAVSWFFWFFFLGQ